MVWGRNKEKAMNYQAEMAKEGYTVEIANTLENLATSCNLIVTNSFRIPLIKGEWITPEHILLLWLGYSGKRELDANVPTKAIISLQTPFLNA